MHACMYMYIRMLSLEAPVVYVIWTNKVSFELCKFWMSQDVYFFKKNAMSAMGIIEMSNDISP